LTAGNHRSLYIPKGFAHGFISLADDTEVLYMMSVPYAPGFATGLRWNDPALGIRWPLVPTVVSARDAEYPLLDSPPLRDPPPAL
jgi:dTDP-4-dehydrorhamnose 3,5-epimerase